MEEAKQLFLIDLSREQALTNRALTGWSKNYPNRTFFFVTSEQMPEIIEMLSGNSTRYIDGSTYGFEGQDLLVWDTDEGKSHVFVTGFMMGKNKNFYH